MEYGRIVSRSFEIAWQHKWLWLFGMFAAGTGYNLNFEYMGLSANPFTPADIEHIDFKALFAAYIGFIPLILIIGLMAILSLAAIIDSVNRIERGGAFSFSTAFSAGIDFFFRIIGFGIIAFIVAMTFFFIMVIGLTIAFSINTALGVLASFITFFLFLIFIFSITQISNLGYRVLVIRNSGIIEAIGEGFQLVKMYFGENVAAFFILMAFGIGFAIFNLIIWLIFNLPIDAVINALNLTSFPAVITGLFLGMPITFITAGYFGVFVTTFMTLFYIELVEPKQESDYLPQQPEVDFDQ